MMRAQLVQGSGSSRYEWAIYAEGTQGFRGYIDTDNVSVLEAGGNYGFLELRFRRLAFGRSGHSAKQIVDMELIWLAALIDAGCDLVRYMIESLGEMTWWSADARPSNWDTFEWIGRDIGIDCMIDAYLDGVPIEHILPDVDFQPVLNVNYFYTQEGVFSLGA